MIFAAQAKEVSNQAVDLKIYMEQVEDIIRKEASSGKYQATYKNENPELLEVLAQDLIRRKYDVTIEGKLIRISWI